MTTTIGHGKNSVVFFDAFRLSQIISKAKMDLKVGSANVTALEDAADAYLQGKLGGTVSATGFLGGVADGWDALANTSLTDSSHVLTLAPTGITASSPAWLLYGFTVGTPQSYDVNDAVMLDWAGQLTGPIARGKVLTAATTVTGTGAQTGINIGTTTSSQTTVVHVLLTAVTGSGSLTIVTQESSDNGSGDAYATISGMTSTLTTAGSASRQTFTGVTEAWKRTNVTAFSGFTNATVLVAIGTAAQ